MKRQTKKCKNVKSQKLELEKKLFFQLFIQHLNFVVVHLQEPLPSAINESGTTK